MPDLNTRVTAIIASHLNLPYHDLEPATVLDKIDADSLDRVEISISLEDEFHITIAGDEELEWRTVGDVIRAVKARTDADVGERP